MRILFAGGGTGGHVFPGVALAQHLSQNPRNPQNDVFWLCTSRAFDNEHLSSAGISFEPLASPRWGRLRGFLGPMASSILAAAKRIRSFRPDVVVGVGGYGTVPPVVAARALRVPYVLLEQNVVPGKANQFLASGAKRIYTQWEEARAAFKGNESKVMATGSPLRAKLKRVPADEARARLGLRDQRPTVAVVGGSQGAEALNRGMMAGLEGVADRLQIIHVTGKGRTEPVEREYRDRGATATVREFVSEMDCLYSVADLVISRAGALAIAEMAAVEVPSVLVPLPNSAGDHQRANARAAARTGGAIYMEEPELMNGGLAPILRKLVAEDPEFNNMRRGLRPLARPGAARAILDDLGTILNR